MDQKTLTALQQSIAKWEANAKAINVADTQVGANSCALCQAFPEEDCKGCPVAEATGISQCEGSPFYAARWERDSWLRYNLSVRCRDNFRTAAQAEVDFLKSLLPKDDSHE